MTTHSRAELEGQVHWLNEWLGIQNMPALTISISWAMGQPRLVIQGGAREISPRLDRGQMSRFLDGMEAAMAMLDRKAFEEARARKEGVDSQTATG